MTQRTYDLENSLKAYFPVFFEVLDENKLNWDRINKRSEEVIEDRKIKLEKRRQSILIEVGFIDLILSSIQGREHARSFLSFIRKLFEELTLNLAKDEKRLIKSNLYGLLTNVDLKYLNFLGELCVLNQIKKRTEWKLISVECPFDVAKKQGPKIDFKFVTATGREMMIEVVNLHLDERVVWTNDRIHMLLSQKLPAKVRVKGLGTVSNFFLFPVLWGAYESISRFVEFYKTNNPNYPSCLIPSCFLSYTYGGAHEVVHKFGSIDTILVDV